MWLLTADFTDKRNAPISLLFCKRRSINSDDDDDDETDKPTRDRRTRTRTVLTRSMLGSIGSVAFWTCISSVKIIDSWTILRKLT